MDLEEINFLRKNSCKYGNLRKIFQTVKNCKQFLKKLHKMPLWTKNQEISDLPIWQKHFLTAGSLGLPYIFCENIWHFCIFFSQGKNLFLRKIKLYLRLRLFKDRTMCKHPCKNIQGSFTLGTSPKKVAA